MDNIKALKTAYKTFQKYGKIGDMLSVIKHIYGLDKKIGYDMVRDYREYLKKHLKQENAEAMLKESYLLVAKDYFDDYCLYLEWDRPTRKQFYLPRRKQLLPLVFALQDLAEWKIELLAISMPPGTGKSSLAIFYLTWMAGNNPNEPILGGSHSNSFLEGVYEECLRIITDSDEYNWAKVFPDVPFKDKDAKNLRIDLDKSKRFQTLEFSSIGSGNAGKVRAVQLLYCDDLVDGIDTALSIDALDKLWQRYTADLKQRKQGDHCRELHIATRWSVKDVIGRLETYYGESRRARFISVPALDENDESNFDYPYGLGYNTATLHQQRNMIDDATWRAVYMNQPIEREGVLYDPSELRRYYELPMGEPDAIIGVCDTKEQGNDDCVLPLAYQYGEDFYIEKFICDNGKPNIIEERIIDLLVERKADIVRFESNRGGSLFADNVQKGIKARGGQTRITTKWNNTNKETRIIVASGWVKEHCLFKDISYYEKDKEYANAMKKLTSYTMTNKMNNKHDDVPDAMAELCDFSKNTGKVNAVVIQRSLYHF